MEQGAATVFFTVLDPFVLLGINRKLPPLFTWLLY
jgi:hypothetical protein